MQLFDALEPAVESALTESIRRFGVLVPVVVTQDGELLDGHHRKRIADAIGASYRVDVVTVADDDEAREIARTLNADRRHLDATKRREMVAHLRAKGHSFRAIAGAVGATLGQVQRDLSTVSTDTVPERVVGLDGKSRPARRPTIVPAKNEREAQRAQEALAVLGDAAPSRTLDVKRAERLAREHISGRRRVEQVAKSTISGNVVIKHGDFRQVLDLPDGSVDAIITDPPYPAEFLDLFSDLSDLAARILKPSGVLVAMVGHLYLREYMARLDEKMSFRWVAAYIMPGPRARVHPARVSTGWKPLLVYERSDATGGPALVDDLFLSDGDDKDHHHWGQSECGFASIVERFTQPGDLVVDPFLGGGTTAVVCRDLGRSFIGCDVDADAVQTSRERVA